MVNKSLTATLKDSTGHDFEFSQDIDDVFVSDDVFAGLDSEWEQRSFYLENFNLVVRLTGKKLYLNYQTGLFVHCC